MVKVVPPHLRKNAAKCIFCGVPGLTKTHIWPAWLNRCLEKQASHQTFNVSNQSFRETIEFPPDKPKQGDLFSQKPYLACEACNNGWMKEFEDALSQKLSPAIAAGKEVCLIGDEITALASWVCLFTILAERHMSACRAISSAERFYLKRHKVPPPNWAIFVGGNVGYKWYKTFRYRNRFLSLDQNVIHTKAGSSSERNFQISTCGIGYLLFQAASFPEPGLQQDFEAATRASGLIKIWPQKFKFLPFYRRKLLLPPRKMFDDDEAQEIADGFYDRAFARMRFMVENVPQV